ERGRARLVVIGQCPDRQRAKRPRRDRELVDVDGGGVLLPGLPSDGDVHDHTCFDWCPLIWWSGIVSAQEPPAAPGTETDFALTRRTGTHPPRYSTRSPGVTSSRVRTSAAPSAICCARTRVQCARSSST